MNDFLTLWFLGFAGLVFGGICAGIVYVIYEMWQDKGVQKMSQEMSQEMVEPELTPWYPPEIKPVREGVYEVSIYNEETWFSYFDGESWYLECMSLGQAEDCYKRKLKVLTQQKTWRGIQR